VKMDARWLRNSFVYLVIMVAVLAIFFTLFSPQSRETQVPITDLMAIVVRDAKQNRVDTLVVQGNRLLADTSEGRKVAIKSDKTDVLDLLNQNGVRFEQVKVEVREPSQFTSWLGIIGSFLPVIVFGALLVFMMRQAQGSNNQAMSFGKSRARVFTGNKQTLTFGDVAGVEEAKQELAEIVEFLKYPEKFAALGARIPRGVLGLWALRELARRTCLAPSLERLASPSSQSRGPSSLRCLSVLVRAGSVTSLTRRSVMPPALCSWMKSMQLGASAVLDLVAATMSVSRP